MADLIVVVRVNSSKTCFIDFSESLQTFWENEVRSAYTLLQTRVAVPVSVKCPVGELCTVWSGKSVPEGDDHAIYIDREFASHYGLQEAALVQIQFISEHIPTANRVTVCPCETKDWEVLELNSSLIENVLLDHISLVHAEQVFSLHLGLSTIVSLKVFSTEPRGMVYLQEFTEVVIAPCEDLSAVRRVENSIQGFANEGKYINETYTYLRKQSVCNDTDTSMNYNDNIHTRFSSIHESEDVTCKLTRKRKQIQIHAIPDEHSDRFDNGIVADDDCIVSQAGVPMSECINDDKIDFQTGSSNDEITVRILRKSNLPPYQGFISDIIFRDHHTNQDRYTYIEISSCIEKEIKSDDDIDKNGDDALAESGGIRIVLQVKVLPLSIWNNVFNYAKSNIILVNPFVLAQLRLKGGNMVNATIYEETVDTIKGVILHCNCPTEKLTEDYYKRLETVFYKFIKEGIDLADTIVINDGSMFIFQVGGEFKNVIAEVIGIGKQPCGKITDSSFGNLFVRVEADESSSFCNNEVLEKTLDLKNITNDIIKHIEIGFRETSDVARIPFISNQVVVLIHGRSLATTNGCGKTLVLHSVANHFALYPYFCHIEYVNCVLMRGKKVNTILKSWKKAFEAAIVSEPSIIVFDDLDELVSTVDLLQDGYMKNVYSERLGELFSSMIENILNENRKVFVIGAVSCLASLHSIILPELSSHLFTKYVSLSSLPFSQLEMLDWFVQHTVEGRSGHKSDHSLSESKNLIQKLATYNTKNVKTIATRALGAKFEKLLKELPVCCHFGDCVRYLPSNMVNTTGDVNGICPAQNNVFQKCDITSEMNLTSSDIEKNLESFDKILMNDLNIHKAKTVRWESIGGLKSVKKILKETLLWPAMYPELLSQCPLRLCSGVLLYGAPGTAKTMLASAVAYESGLNFISVKGPELLSKYVGSSEGNVRDLFARAGTAKPCIIFFDELESMAPRRGHDNTGVTDRVVNQLLTELDGVESLNGVFILAATSRPDLIDPALLRPGRFDKSIHCPMPTEDERDEILCILIKEIEVDGSIDVKWLAKCTPGFSGADLKGLVFNAQVECASKQLILNDDNAGKVDGFRVLITMDHFKKALETTQPSVSNEEKKKLSEIFSAISSHSTDGEQSGRKQKFTLA